MSKFSPKHWIRRSKIFRRGVVTTRANNCGLVDRKVLNLMEVASRICFGRDVCWFLIFLLLRHSC